MTDANMNGALFPLKDKWWLSLFKGSEVATNAAFQYIGSGQGDWVMHPTHPQKKHWRVVKKFKVHKEAAQTRDANVNSVVHQGYTRKLVITKPWHVEFDSDAAGSLPTNPRGPFIVGASNAAAALGSFTRATSILTRTYFVDS